MSFEKALKAALSGAGTGSFAGTQQLPRSFPWPCLAVENQVAVSLPVTPEHFAALIKEASVAPFGKGRKTVVDRKVRNAFQIDASRLVVSEEWDTAVQELVGNACIKHLGLPKADGVRADLYKLVLYDKGGFFKPHKDTEKAPGMFATLVIELPSPHSGGGLVVSHQGTTFTFDSGSDSADQFAFHATIFFADTEHEVLPVTEGQRACLVYNVVSTRTDFVVPCGTSGSLGSDLRSVLVPWAQSAVVDPARIALVLDHLYTDANLAFGKLKGRDAQLAQALATIKDVDMYLAMLTHVVSGMPEDDVGQTGSYYQSHWGGGWGGGFNYEPRCGEEDRIRSGKVKLIDFYDSDTTVEQLVGVNGEAVSVRLQFSTSDLFGREFSDITPVDANLEPYTGNEGPSLEYEYHVTVIVLVPRRTGLIALFGTHRIVNESHGKEIRELLKREPAQLFHNTTSLLLSIVDHKDEQFFIEALRLVNMQQGVSSSGIARALAESVRAFGWDAMAPHVAEAVASTPVSRHVDHLVTLLQDLHGLAPTQPLAIEICDKVLQLDTLQDVVLPCSVLFGSDAFSTAEQRARFLVRVAELSRIWLYHALRGYQSQGQCAGSLFEVLALALLSKLDDGSADNATAGVSWSQDRYYSASAWRSSQQQSFEPVRCLADLVPQVRLHGSDSLYTQFMTALSSRLDKASVAQGQSLMGVFEKLLPMLLQGDHAVQHLFARRILQLRAIVQAIPSFELPVPEYPGYPGINQFLRGPKRKYTHKGDFARITEARKLADHLTRFLGRVQLPHHVTVVATGSGRQSCVEITKGDPSTTTPIDELQALESLARKGKLSLVAGLLQALAKWDLHPPFSVSSKPRKRAQKRPASEVVDDCNAAPAATPLTLVSVSGTSGLNQTLHTGSTASSVSASKSAATAIQTEAAAASPFTAVVLGEAEGGPRLVSATVAQLARPATPAPAVSVTAAQAATAIPAPATSVVEAQPAGPARPSVTGTSFSVPNAAASTAIPSQDSPSKVVSPFFAQQPNKRPRVEPEPQPESAEPQPEVIQIDDNDDNGDDEDSNDGIPDADFAELANLY